MLLGWRCSRRVCARVRVPRHVVAAAALATFPATHGGGGVGAEALGRGGDSALIAQLPPAIRDKLATLPSEILTTLLAAEYEDAHDAHGQNAVAAAVTSVITLPKTLRDIAEYYFRQSGKLLRPTVSMLMSEACNEVVSG